MRRRIAIVGGGWAGCAAALQALDDGHHVTLFEMAGQLGGRARTVEIDGLRLDNGQHILIGGYTETLRLLERVGVDTRQAFMRSPLRLLAADGTGLSLPQGPAALAFGRAAMSHSRWKLTERLRLLAVGASWAARGFRCRPGLTVAQLCATLPERVREELIDPLCVAALNTPSSQADAAVFLRVLKDSLFGPRGAADLLLPLTDLGALLPDGAARAILKANGEVRLSARVSTIVPGEGGCRVDGEHFDAVVLAASPKESARLAAPVAPAWARSVQALAFEPIVTVYARAAGLRFPFPMLALREGPQAPAQFAFDLGVLRGQPGLLALVISGATPWVERGVEAIEQAVVAQARQELAGLIDGPLQVLRTFTEKRATFLCTPGLERAPARIAEWLWCAGDHVAGPYPATLEGAVRSGRAAARVAGGSGRA